MSEINWCVLAKASKIFAFLLREEPIVGEHDASKYKMKDNSNFNPLHRLERDVLIESGGSRIELKKKPFVHPV